MVVCYALLTGAAPSVIRAAVMQILLLLAPLVKREEDTPTSLCAAMLVILLQNPWAVADLSFQLSFASMAGLLLFGNRLYHAMTRRARRKLPALAGKAARRAVCVGLRQSRCNGVYNAAGGLLV